MGDETRVVFKVITTLSGLISAKLGSLSAQWGLRSVVSNSLDRYLPGRHDEPGLTVVVSAEFGGIVERAWAWKSTRGKSCRKKRNPSTRKKRYELLSLDIAGSSKPPKMES